jgi:hypothetical protein
LSVRAIKQQCREVLAAEQHGHADAKQEKCKPVTFHKQKIKQKGGKMSIKKAKVKTAFTRPYLRKLRLN